MEKAMLEMIPAIIALIDKLLAAVPAIADKFPDWEQKKKVDFLRRVNVLNKNKAYSSPDWDAIHAETLKLSNELNLLMREISK